MPRSAPTPARGAFSHGAGPGSQRRDAGPGSHGHDAGSGSHGHDAGSRSQGHGAGSGSHGHDAGSGSQGHGAGSGSQGRGGALSYAKQCINDRLESHRRANACLGDPRALICINMGFGEARRFFCCFFT